MYIVSLCSAKQVQHYLLSVQEKKGINSMVHVSCWCHLLSATPCKLIDNHSMEVAKTSVSSGNTV